MLVNLHLAARDDIVKHIHTNTGDVYCVQELSKSLQSAKGKLYAVKCDVSKNSDIEAAFKWVKDKLGGVDIMVNNAGVAPTSPLVGKSPRLLLVVLMVWLY
jgi:NAD(P)-dependent dehydrogenase (short-subunit alcohol dehydrogenase family)